MRQGSWVRFLVLVAACLYMAACDPYAYYPARSQKVTPPPGEAGPPPPPPAPAPAPAPDLAQQVKDLQARVQQLETRLAEAEGQRPAPARRGHERPSPKATGAPAGYPPPPGTQDKLYVEGYHLYQGKKYAAARDKFAKYLKSQPRGPKSAEARYYLAYSFQHEGKHKEAAMEFNKLVTQFPKSSLAPAALKQQALAYKADNRIKLYQSTLSKLVKTYPQSPEAREAQKLLKEGGR
jgi:TolA-binding protein